MLEKDIGMGVLPSLTEGLATKDGILYAGTGKYLRAIDASTGEIVVAEIVTGDKTKVQRLHYQFPMK